MFIPPMKTVPKVSLEYKYLEAEGNIGHLTREVNLLVNSGWEVDGELVGTNGIFGQRMVKR